MNDDIVGLDDLPRPWQVLVKMSMGNIAALERVIDDLKHANAEAIRFVSGMNVGTTVIFDNKVKEILAERAEQFDAEQRSPDWSKLVEATFTKMMSLALDHVKREESLENQEPS